MNLIRVGMSCRTLKYAGPPNTCMSTRRASANSHDSSIAAIVSSRPRPDAVPLDLAVRLNWNGCGQPARDVERPAVDQKPTPPPTAKFFHTRQPPRAAEHRADADRASALSVASSAWTVKTAVDV